MSDTMEAGLIVEWHKEVGDAVSSGDILAEIETDKATMEMESYQEGTLLYKAGEKGESVKVGSLLAVLGEKGEDVDSIIEEYKKKEQESGNGEAKEEEQESSNSSEAKSGDSDKSSGAQPEGRKQQADANGSASSQTEDGRIKASPLARSMAKEAGIDLGDVKGTGEGGRIVKRDIENFEPQEKAAQASSSSAVASGAESYEDIPLSNMRKTIAKRLGESKFSAPHFYLTMEIDMNRVIKFRKKLNEESETKISFNDIIVKASALALRKHPMVNASFMDDHIRQYRHIHVGVAVAIPEGLIVPVLRHADNTGLETIAKNTRELAEKARNKQLQPEEFQGNTFTISNLGMYGIEEFTAIINPPDVCILAVGGIKEVPEVREKDGRRKISVRSKMKVTLSCDHRVVDGATGSEFLKTFKSLLESPFRMLL